MNWFCIKGSKRLIYLFSCHYIYFIMMFLPSKLDNADYKGNICKTYNYFKCTFEIKTTSHLSYKICSVLLYNNSFEHIIAQYKNSHLLESFQ